MCRAAVTATFFDQVDSGLLLADHDAKWAGGCRIQPVIVRRRDVHGDPAQPPHENRWRRLAPLAAPLTPLVVSIVLLVVTHGTWADPWIDNGAQLDAPARMVRGEVPYRDFLWHFGPFSIYLNALAFTLFGPWLSTIFALNFFVFLALLAILFTLCRSVADRFGAALATSTAAIFFGFSSHVAAAGYNFMCPYSHELTHGLVLSAGAVLAASKFSETGRTGSLAMTGVLVGLSFLTKPEVFLAAVLGIALPLGVRTLTAHERPILPYRVALFAMAALAPLAVAFATLAAAMPWQDAVSALVAPHLAASSSAALALPFYRRGMGLDAPARGLLLMSASLGGWIAAFLPIIVGALAQRSAHTAVRAGGFVLLVAPPLLLGILHAGIPWFAAAAALPILTLTIIVVAAARWARAGPTAQTGLVRAAALGALSLGLLSKMILNARFHQYGFALALPATVLVVAILLGAVPRWIAARGGAALGYRVSATLVLALALVSCLQGIRRAVEYRSVRVEAPGGTFFADDRGRVLQSVLNRVQTGVAPSETLSVLPEGAMVNFLAKRRGASWTTYNVPPWATGSESEASALAELQRDPPDHVIFVDFDISEYGYRQFGVDYAPRVGNWIRSEYEPVWHEGPKPSGGTNAVIGARHRPLPVLPPTPRLGESPWSAWLRQKR